MLGQSLMLIHTGRAPTRSLLTSALGVTRATAGTLVSDLQALGLIRVDDAGPGNGQQGRPSHRLSVAPDGPVAVAAEVDADGYRVALVGLGAQVIAAESGRGGLAADPGRALAEVAETAARLVATAGRPCVGAGLSITSAVASPDGTLVGSLYTGWPDGTPARDLLAGQLLLAGVTGPGGRGLRCSVANDVNCAALAEYRHGAGRGASHLLMLATGARGVGGALVLDGRLYTGSTGLGMEAGHISVDLGGRPCPCGSRGCLEVEADAWRFLELACDSAAAGDGAAVRGASAWGSAIKDSAIKDSASGVAAGAAVAAVAGGTGHDRAISLLRSRYSQDPGVRAAAGAVVVRLGAGLAGLVNVLNPDRVLLGGLYGHLLAADPAGLRAAVAERGPWGRAAGVPLLSAALADGALLGAAEIAWQPVLDNPGILEMD
jgi:predicted NBD/HSP70 family sugar kinase